MKKSIYLHIYVNPYQGRQEPVVVGVLRDDEARKSTNLIPLLWLGVEEKDEDAGEDQGLRQGFFGSGNLQIPSEAYFYDHSFFVGGITLDEEKMDALRSGKTAGKVFKAALRGHFPTVKEMGITVDIPKKGGEDK